jgi:hypothetical protein
MNVKWEPIKVKISDKGGVLPEGYGTHVLRHSAVIASPQGTYEHVTLADGSTSTFEPSI